MKDKIAAAIKVAFKKHEMGVDNFSALFNSDLEPFIETVLEQLALTGVGYRAMDMEEILNEAQRRQAKHSVQYADYSLDTWTVASDLLEHRKTNLLADASVRKVKIEYEM
jgi:hypothetical protein